MELDNNRKYTSTNFNRVKKGGKAVDSDHMTTVMKVNLKVMPDKPKKIEVFHFKDKHGIERFKLSTTETEEFTNCFMDNKDVSDQASDWMKVLVTHGNNSFPKIRIRNKQIKMSAASQLINKKNKLLKEKKHRFSQNRY